LAEQSFTLIGAKNQKFPLFGKGSLTGSMLCQKVEIFSSAGAQNTRGVGKIGNF